jgi:chitosanase
VKFSRLVTVALAVTSAALIAAPAMAGPADLDDPVKKDHAMQIVSSAENSSLDWRAQFGYIEDIGDGRGYTGGIIGFTSGTHDMLELVQRYTDRSPGNVLAKYLPALRAVDGTDSHEGLDPQESERDRVYFDPAVALAEQDGLQALGQFAYYDAAVVHGPEGLQDIRSRALGRAQPPSQGGDETGYLNAFLDERVIEMKKEEAHSDTSRIDTAQRVWLQDGNLTLDTPLRWHVYGDPYEIS